MMKINIQELYIIDCDKYLEILFTLTIIVLNIIFPSSIFFYQNF